MRGAPRSPLTLLVLLLPGLIAACGPALPPPPEELDATSYTAPFPEGAFPLVLPSDAVHEGVWRASWRADRACLDCHQRGANGAPRPRHLRVVPEALYVRCRSCHTTRVEEF